MKKPKKGKEIAAIPSFIADYHTRVDVDQILGMLLPLHGKGFPCELPLFKEKDSKHHHFHKKSDPAPLPVFGDFNGQVDPTDPVSMAVRHKDFIVLVGGAARILGDKYLLDKYIKTLPVEASHATLDRYDRVIVEPILDDFDNHMNQGGLWKVLKGVPSGTPVMPPLESDVQVTAARIHVRAASVSILLTDINNDDFKECLLSADEIESRFAVGGSDLTALEGRVSDLEQFVEDATAPGGVVDDILSDISDLKDGFSDISNQICTNATLISALTAGTATDSAQDLKDDKDTLVTETAGEPVALKTVIGGIDAKVERLKTSIDTFDSFVTFAAAQPGLMDEDILGLKLDLSAIQKGLVLLDDELSGLSLSGAADTARIAMQADILAIQGQLSPMLGQLAALANCVAMSALNMVGFLALIGTIGSKLGQITSDYTNIRGAFDKLEQEFISLKVLVAGNTADIADMKKLLGMRGDMLCEPFGSPGSGANQFNQPWYMAAGHDGKVYTADIQNRRIRIQNADGSDGGSIDVSTELPGIVASVAVNSDSTLMAVSGNTDEIHLYDLPGGAFSETVGSSGNGDGEFNLCIDVGFDADDYLYGVDFNNHSYQKFDKTTFAFIERIGTGSPGFGTSPLELNFPRSIAFAPTSGDVIITENNSGGNRVIRLDSDGAFLNFIGQAAAAGADFDTWINKIDLGVGGFAQRNQMVEMSNGDILWCLTRRYSIGLDTNGNPIYGFVSNGLDFPFTGEGTFAGAFGVGRIPAGVGKVDDRIVQMGCGFNQNSLQMEIWWAYSDDNSLTWVQGKMAVPESIDTGLVNGEMDIDPVTGDIYWIFEHGGAAAASIYKSSNSAGSFSLVNNDVFDGNPVLDVSIACYDSGKMLAHTNSGRQSRSVDGAVNFTYEGNKGVTIIGNPFIRKLTDGRMVICGIDGAATFDGAAFQISKNDGDTWEPEFSPIAFDGWTQNLGTFHELGDGRIIFAGFDNNVNDDSVIFSPYGALAVVGDGNSQFNRPQQASSDNVEVFVFERNNARVQVFDMAGNFLYKFYPSVTRQPNDDLIFADLGGGVLAADGALWTSSAGQHRIFKCRKPETVIAKYNEMNTALDVLATELNEAPNSLTVTVPALGKL